MCKNLSESYFSMATIYISIAHTTNQFIAANQGTNNTPIVFLMQFWNSLFRLQFLIHRHGAICRCYNSVIIDRIFKSCRRIHAYDIRCRATDRYLTKYQLLCPFQKTHISQPNKWFSTIDIIVYFPLIIGLQKQNKNKQNHPFLYFDYAF